jgi:enterochelin esterase-like enzyme
MKKFMLSFIMVSVFCLSNLSAQSSMLDTTKTFKSEILNMTVHYSLYLPPSFNTTDTVYPVLYLLHGMWGHHRNFPDMGIQSVMDAAIIDGYKEMVIIMPDGLDAFYCNDGDARNLRYEDFMYDEFIPALEDSFRVDTAIGMRAIAGLSMGGYGATYHAFKYPDFYSSSYSMSGAFLENGNIPSLYSLVYSMTPDVKANLRAYTMEVGTEDNLVYSYNVNWHNFLTVQNITHTYIERPGSHNAYFWTACLPKVVRFTSNYFGDPATSVRTYNTLEKDLYIYPNPSAEQVYVKTGSANFVSLLTITGILIERKAVKNPIEEFYIDDLTQGVYLINIEKAEKTVVKTLVVQ